MSRPECKKCEAPMDPVAVLADLHVWGCSFISSTGNVELDGYAKEKPTWFCRSCKGGWTLRPGDQESLDNWRLEREQIRAEQKCLPQKSTS